MVQFRSALPAFLRQRQPACLLVGQIGLSGHSEASCVHAMVSVAHRPPSFRVMNPPGGTCSVLAAAGYAFVSRRAGKARKRRSILHVARRCAGRVALQGAGPCDASSLLRNAGRRGRSGPVSTCKLSKSRCSGDAIQGSHVVGRDFRNSRGPASLTRRPAIPIPQAPRAWPDECQTQLSAV